MVWVKFVMPTTMSTMSSSVSECESHVNLVKKLTKAYYRDDQQVKFMDLQAEVDSLLEQLQNLKSEQVEAPRDEAWQSPLLRGILHSQIRLVINPPLAFDT